jgi:hypothetical protein
MMAAVALLMFSSSSSSFCDFVLQPYDYFLSFVMNKLKLRFALLLRRIGNLFTTTASKSTSLTLLPHLA